MQFIFYKKVKEKKIIYLNLDKIYNLNFNKIEFWNSYINKNKEKIIQEKNWKCLFLEKMKTKNIKKLAKETTLQIYKNIYEKRKQNKRLEKPTNSLAKK